MITNLFSPPGLLNPKNIIFCLSITPPAGFRFVIKRKNKSTLEIRRILKKKTKFPLLSLITQGRELWCGMQTPGEKEARPTRHLPKQPSKHARRTDGKRLGQWGKRWSGPPKNWSTGSQCLGPQRSWKLRLQVPGRNECHQGQAKTNQGRSWKHGSEVSYHLENQNCWTPQTG